MLTLAVKCELIDTKAVVLGSESLLNLLLLQKNCTSVEWCQKEEFLNIILRVGLEELRLSKYFV